MKVYCEATGEAAHIVNGRYAGSADGPEGADLIVKTAEAFNAIVDRLPAY